jgi:hypothetical protein
MQPAQHWAVPNESGPREANRLRRKEFDAPFPFPLRGKPGREGSPHAGSTLRASQKRWLVSMHPAPPTRGLPPPCASPARIARTRSTFGNLS